MYSYQVFIMIVLCLLCLNKASFYGAFVILTAFCIYSPLIIPMPAMYYYSCAGLLNLIVGLILQKDYNAAATCSYSLVIVNLVGYFIYEKGYDPVLYDNISAIILIIQLSSLLPKGLLNGLGHSNKHSLVKSDFFNGL